MNHGLLYYSSMKSEQGQLEKKLPTDKLVDLFFRYFVYLKHQKTRFILNLLLGICIILISATLIWMLGQGVNSIYKREFNLIPQYLISFCILFFSVQIIRYTRVYLQEAMQQEVIHALRRDLYSHIIKLSTPFKNTQASGDLLTRLSQDVTKISRFVVRLPSNLIAFSLTALIYSALLFYIDSFMALIALSLTPVFILQQHFFLRKTRRTSRSFLSYRGKMASFEEESINNLQGIVSFNADHLMLGRFNKLFVKFRRAAMKNLMLQNLFKITFEMLAAIIAIGLIAVGLDRVDSGILTVAGLVNFILYLVYIMAPIRGLAHLPVSSQILAAASERVSEILDKIPNVVEEPNAIELNKLKGKIEFRNLSFGYDNTVNVINDINITIMPGEFIGVVGPSGVGKSTLAKLLLRFYDPSKGEIYLDDIKLRKLKLSTIRSQISVVWQEPFLIDDSVIENIRLANEFGTDEEIKKAAKAAFAHNFIESLPNAYETSLGSRGDRLSVGQKQRIALTQAFMRQSPILILDEATSALDSHSEIAIKNTLRQLKERCTLFVIAHRYSTIAEADRIIYLNSDGCVTIGTLEELSKNHEHFEQSLKHQFSHSVNV